MQALRTSSLKSVPSSGRLTLVAAILVLLALGTTVVVHNAGHMGAGASAPAPAYVSQASSLIGTADGSLVEGDNAVPAPMPAPARPALPAGGALAVLATLALLVIATVLMKLTTRFSRHLT